MNGTRRARQERLWSVAEQPLLTEPLPQATAATVHDNFCKVGLGKGTIILLCSRETSDFGLLILSCCSRQLFNGINIEHICLPVR